MAKHVLIKPLVTEKTDILSQDAGKYTFVVDKKANKIEIKKAIEEMYDVTVDKVNTMITPGKTKMRYTKTGIQRGKKSSYKKAIVTLADGDTIDFYGEL